MSRSKLIFGVTKCISIVEQRLGEQDAVALRCAQAYEELRRSVPKGDIVIHMYIEADSPEDVGVVYDDLAPAPTIWEPGDLLQTVNGGPRWQVEQVDGDLLHCIDRNGNKATVMSSAAWKINGL